MNLETKVNPDTGDFAIVEDGKVLLALDYRTAVIMLSETLLGVLEAGKDIGKHTITSELLRHVLNYARELDLARAAFDAEEGEGGAT